LTLVYIPDNYHVVIYLLQLLLGNLHRVGRRIELVGLEALIAEGDLKWLIFGLVNYGICQLQNVPDRVGKPIRHCQEDER
jgi:hypothetical protein